MTPEQMALAKKYADAERAARRKIAPVWDAIRHALAEDAVFNQRVVSGEQLASVQAGENLFPGVQVAIPDDTPPE